MPTPNLNDTPSAGPLTEADFRAFDQPDDEAPGPAWAQWIDRHPLLVAIGAVGLGMCPIFWS